MKSDNFYSKRENLPPAEHINHVEKRFKNPPLFLELDGSDAKGLIGTAGE